MNKMGFKNWPSWVKGGIGGLVTYIIILISQIFCFSDSTPNFLCGDPGLIWNLTLFQSGFFGLVSISDPNTEILSMVISFMIYIFVGSIIGWIIGKLKSKKQQQIQTPAVSQNFNQNISENIKK